MEDRKRRSWLGLSTVEAVVGVITLLVVVASLFMLKGKFVFDEPEADAVAESAADSTPQVGVPSTGAGPDLSIAATTEPPKVGEIVFGAGSARLPVAVEDTVAPLVTALRNDALLTAVIVAGAATVPAALANARANAIRHAFEADGISAARLVIDRPSGHDAQPGLAAGSGPARTSPPPRLAPDTLRIELRSR